MLREPCSIAMSAAESSLGAAADGATSAADTGAFAGAPRGQLEAGSAKSGPADAVDAFDWAPFVDVEARIAAGSVGGPCVSRMAAGPVGGILSCADMLLEAVPSTTLFFLFSLIQCFNFPMNGVTR